MIDLSNINEDDLQKILKKKAKKALSEADVGKLCDNQCILITYDELCEIDKLSDLFNKRVNPYQKVLLLYMSKPDFGHWCALAKKGNSVMFFDPYGYKIDRELKFIDEEFRDESNQDYPYLTKLLYESPYKIEYNDFPLQNRTGGENTCGRWCGLFLKYSDIGLNKFVDIFKKYKDYNLDMLATGLTFNI